MHHDIYHDLKNILPGTGSRLKTNVPMSAHTTFKIGGPADIFFEPEHLDEIIAILGYCRKQSVPCLVIGNGSNILVSDAGIRGAVVSIGNCFSGMVWENGLLMVKAGTKVCEAAAFAARQGCAGLEFISGIPGTLGGAIYMNAGAYDHCMADVTHVTEYLDENLEIKNRCGDEHRFSYRRSYFTSRDCVILRSGLRLCQDEPDKILARMADLEKRRKEAQPLEMPSAGSAFKRPNGNYAGKIISECGLKGFCMGDAQISEKHAGFIVNLGRANADDIRRLFEYVQETVARKTGISLEPEVRFVGDWQHWHKEPACI